MKSRNDMNRRSFLKMMGWGSAGVALSGCDMPTTVTLEEGAEKVLPYVTPEEFVIPGIGVWYASTCLQCPAGCGIHGRVREGRVLKVEGNPDAVINAGGLCQMGQAGLQVHYNPDRLRKPKIRKGERFVDAGWEEALALVTEKVAASGGDKIAWFTNTVSGHQAVLLDAYLKAVGSSSLYVHETINNAVAQVAAKNIFDDATPVYAVAKAKVILSFGADLIGASDSPVGFAKDYARFRESPRGMLIQIEPKMTLTGANADLWVPARPGTEGVVALGLANLLIEKHQVDPAPLSDGLRRVIKQYPGTKVSEISGIPVETLQKIAAALKAKSPTLVVTGQYAQGHAHGYQNVAAAMALNVLLGNVGQTLLSGGEFPFPQLLAKRGNSRDLLAFAEAAESGAFDVAFFVNSNPVYTAPAYLKFKEKLSKIPFKVALSLFEDETTAHVDVILPLASYLEDWGTHVAPYQPETKTVSMQQPLMEPLYPGSTRGLGDVLLALLKDRLPEEYGGFEDYYAFLRGAFDALPADYKQGMDSENFWRSVLTKGVLEVPTGDRPLTAQVETVALPEYEKNTEYPFHLVPSARLGLWDGRHANLPWLQEAPDQIAKAVWGSWAEMHPATASRLGIQTGDFVVIESKQGKVEVPVYVYRGIHKDAIAVPMGQGHESYGRYASGLGVNPLKILEPVTDQKTGELALMGTRVKVTRQVKGQRKNRLVRFGGSETQVGRKLVATITADQFNRTEGA